MNVKTILDKKGREVTTARKSAKVSEIAKTLWSQKIGALVISEDEIHVDGIISERDIVHGLSEHGVALLERQVTDVMTREGLTCSPDETVTDVMSKMSSRRLRHLPCVQGCQLCGMISIGDILQNRLEEIENEAEAMRAYITAG